MIDPVVLTSCDETFCRRCVEPNLESHLRICAKCNIKILSINDLIPADPSLHRELDDLLVKCNDCEQTNIQRGTFDEHVKTLCPKSIVVCSASDIKCPWTRPADELKQHVASCHYEQIRHVLVDLIEKHDRLTEKCQQLEATIMQYETGIYFIRIFCHFNSN